MSFLEFMNSRREAKQAERETPRQRPHSAWQAIDRAPVGAVWRDVHPRGGSALRAWKAERDGGIDTGRGVLRYRAGADYIVEHGPKDYAVIRGDIFEQTYKRVGTDRYKKRTDIMLRYFTLPYPVRVKTLEGVQDADPGDWIIEGVAGELWPVKPDKAREKYAPA